MRDICDKLNMVPDQSHAPFIFNNLSSDDIRTQLERCVEASAVLGVKNIVVHADTYYEKDFDFDRALNVIYEVYAPIVESAVKNGIKIAMETLFEAVSYTHLDVYKRQVLMGRYAHQKPGLLV